MAGMTEAAPRTAMTQCRPGKRRRASASATQAPKTSERTVEIAAWARANPRTPARYGMIARSDEGCPAAENRAANPPATRRAIARATTAPAGGGLNAAPRSVRSGVQPFVDERTPVVLDLVRREHQGRRGLDEVAEGGRQTGRRSLGREHPVALGHRGLEGLGEHERQEAASKLRLLGGARHACEFHVQVMAL